MYRRKKIHISKRKEVLNAILDDDDDDNDDSDDGGDDDD